MTLIRRTSTVGTSLTTIGILVVSCSQQITVQIKNTGAIAFNAFQVQARLNSQADWIAIKTTGYTGTPPDTFPVWATSNPVTLAGGSGVVIQIAGIYADVRLQASVASGSTTVDCYGSVDVFEA